MSGSLLDCSHSALLAGAQKVSPPVHYNQNGYAPSWKDNLMNGLPLTEIVHDLSGGAGHELDSKLCAAHSSAALVANTFGPWRTAPALLVLGGITGFRSVCFEATCPTGMGGTPPHLDLLAEGDLPVAVESKCTEWMEPKSATFSDSYNHLRSSHGDSPWFGQMLQLREEPKRYRFLDAAQLVKHAFGLLTRYKAREVRLVYLYWEPRNSEDWEECHEHRAEAKDIAGKVERSPVRLIPMCYSELWAEWERRSITDHLRYLRTRYDLEV
jgi:hypothetical protein